jgi:trehalose 6-phosphate phosphatase
VAGLTDRRGMMRAVLLPEPTTPAGRAGLAAVLADPARALLALDFDGTLAPIVQRPEDAVPAPGALEAVQALAGRIGNCAVISGRAAADVVARGGFAGVTGLRVLGHYGLERWSAGHLDSPDVSPGVAVARARLAALMPDAPRGVHLEDKQHSLVVHTRPADDPARALEQLTPALRAIADEAGLEMVPGRLVVELRPAGVDKGRALASLVRELDARAVVFIGDDLGDLPAFDAVEALRSDGVPGVSIASVDPAAADAPASLAARGDLVLDGPAAVVSFLLDLAAAVGEP